MSESAEKFPATTVVDQKGFVRQALEAREKVGTLTPEQRDQLETLRKTGSTTPTTVTEHKDMTGYVEPKRKKVEPYTPE